MVAIPYRFDPGHRHHENRFLYQEPVFYLCSHTFSDHKNHFYRNLSNFYSPKRKILRFWETEFICISPKTALFLGERSLVRRIIRRKSSDYQSTFPITGSVLCFYLLRLKMVEIMIFWQRLRDSHRYFFCYSLEVL